MLITQIFGCVELPKPLQIDGLEWCRDVMNKDYMPCTFPEELIESIEWIHCLATLDTNILHPEPKFCDEDGYDAHPRY